MSSIVKDLSAQVNTKRMAGERYATAHLHFLFFAFVDEIIPGDGQYGWVRTQLDLSTQNCLPSEIPSDIA
jgi:hypothetical protein